MASHYEWLGTGIMAKELVPIIFTCVTWDLCYVTVTLISSMTMKDLCCYQQRLLKKHNSDAPPMFSMVLIAHFDITIMAAHLPGVMNTNSLVES